MDLNDILNHDATFRYRLLSRMKSDCEYYFGYGNRSANHLWAGNEQDQITAMKALWNSFPAQEKPEWLPLEQIESYEKQFKRKCWTLTDDDCLQFAKPSERFRTDWMFVQICAYPPGDSFYVVHDTIDMSTYTEEDMEDILNTYGYPPLKEFRTEYGTDTDRLLAEMFFETECCLPYGYKGVSWDRCVAQVERITGEDLSQYKQAQKPPLMAQISQAKDSTASGIEKNGKVQLRAENMR